MAKVSSGQPEVIYLSASSSPFKAISEATSEATSEEIFEESVFSFWIDSSLAGGEMKKFVNGNCGIVKIFTFTR